MPYARKSGYSRRARAKRPMVRRTRRAAVRKAPMYRLPSSGFPDRKIVKLKYCAQHSLPSLNGSAYGSHTYRTNSVYDPDYSLGGHQPYAFDEWATLYGRYEVLSSYINVRFLASQAGGPPNNAIVAVLNVDDPDTSATLTTVRERPSSYTKVLTPQTPCRVTRKWSFRKDSPNHAGWDNTAPVTADPADSDYYRIFVSSVDGSSPLQQYSINAIVEIVYVVKFWERQLLDGS